MYKYLFVLSAILCTSHSLTSLYEYKKNSPYSIHKATPHVSYHGGLVVSNIQIVDVLWGPDVNAQIKENMPSFLGAIIQSPWIDWLCEYNSQGQPSPTTSQLIGRGLFIEQKMITPTHTSTSLTDADIQAELTTQLNEGNLPLPHYDTQNNPVTIYVIEFPPGVSIEVDGVYSCQAGGFCAYHDAMDYNGKLIMYSVHPDFGSGSGCDIGCGPGTELQNQQSVHSHEVAEATTDVQGTAWFDSSTGDEIADICEGSTEQGTIVVNGVTYTVQKLWSDSRNACIVTNSNLAAAPTISGSHSVAPGATFTLTAHGGTAPFQWYRNNVFISGVTGSTLTVTNANSSNIGNFYVRGKCTNVSSTFNVALATSTLTTNQLVVNTTNTNGDGIVINATSPATGKCAMRYQLNGANVFRLLKSTGGISINTAATSGAPALDIMANAASNGLALNAGNGAFTIVSATGNTTTAGTLSFNNGGSNTYAAAGSTTASMDIQTGTGTFSAASSATITFNHPFGAAPVVTVLPLDAQTTSFDYYAVSAVSASQATVEAFNTSNALFNNTGNFAYIAIGRAT